MVMAPEPKPERDDSAPGDDANEAQRSTQREPALPPESDGDGDGDEDPDPDA